MNAKTPAADEEGGAVQGIFHLTRTDWQIMAGVFLLALAVRGTYLWQSSANPTFRTPVVDAETYHTMACTLLKRMTGDTSFAVQRGGDPTHSGFFWQPFFYPFFLSVIYLFAGPSILTAKIVQILIGAVTCSLTYLLGRTVFSRAVGVIAAILVAFYGPLIFLEAELLGEGLAAFWSLVLILLFLKGRDGRGYWIYLAIGLCGAMAVITRPTFLAFFLGACAWLAVVLYRQMGWRRFLAPARNCLAGFLLVSLPLAFLNHSRTGNFAIMPSSGGINFYIGNNPDVCKTLTIRPGWAWERLTTWPEREGVRGEAAQQAFYYKKVWEYASSQPLSFLGGMGMKAMRFLCTREIPRNVDVYMFGRWSSLLKALVWKVGPFGFPFGVLLPLAVAGVIGCWRRIPWALGLFITLYPLGIILVFVTGRYRVPTIPALTVVAAAGLVNLLQLIARRRWTTPAVVAVCMVAALAAGTLGGPFCEEQVNYEAELNFDLGIIQYNLKPPQFDKAADYLSKSLELKSDYADAYSELGNVRALQGDLAEASRCYSQAVELDPTHAKAMHNAGLMAYKTGYVNEAMELFRKALAIDPSIAKTHYYLGLALARSGDFRSAVEELERALTLPVPLADRTQVLQAYESLGEAMLRVGRSAEAVKYYRKAVELKTDHLPAIEALTWLLATHPDSHVRNGPQAVALGQRATTIAPTRWQAQDVLAAAYAETERFADAVNAARMALALTESAGQTAEIEQVRARLQLYQSSRPYRQGAEELTSQPASSGISP